MVLTKFGHSKRRIGTIKFSKFACIEKTVDNQLCLSFRLADLRPSANLAEAHLRAFYVSKSDKSSKKNPVDFEFHEMDYLYSKGKWKPQR